MIGATLLWLWGSLTLASVIMAIAWWSPAHDFWRIDAGQRKWSRRLWIAGALVLHAGAMATACGYRALDLLQGVHAPTGSEPGLLLTTSVMLLASKVGLVWAASIDGELRRVRWTWFAFIYAMILWGVFCWTWAARI